MKFRIQTKYSLIILLLIIFAVLTLSGALVLWFRALIYDMATESSEDMAVSLLDQLKKRGEVLRSPRLRLIALPTYDNTP